MERPQGGCNTTCSGITDTRVEMGKHLDGLHYRFTQGTGMRLLIRGSIPVENFCSVLWNSF